MVTKHERRCEKREKHVTKTKCLRFENIIFMCKFVRSFLFCFKYPTTGSMWKELLIWLQIGAAVAFTSQETCPSFGHSIGLFNSGLNSMNSVGKGSCGCSVLKRNNALHKEEMSLSRENIDGEIKLISPYKRTNQMTFVKGGRFTMGTNKPYLPMDGEGPAREVKVNSFYMDIYEASNAEFEVFVNSTGHVTEVEYILII